MKSFENKRTSLAKLFVVAALAGTCCATASADGRTTQYWLDHPSERATKLRECKAHSATTAASIDCVNAGRAAAAALGSGTPVYVGAPPAPSAAPPRPPRPTRPARWRP
jgi:hypothetical protein